MRPAGRYAILSRRGADLRAYALIARGKGPLPLTGAVAAVIRLIPARQRRSVLMNLSRCVPQDRQGALQEAALAVLEGRITPAGAIATFSGRQSRSRSREIPVSQLLAR